MAKASFQLTIDHTQLQNVGESDHHAKTTSSDIDHANISNIQTDQHHPRKVQIDTLRNVYLLNFLSIDGLSNSKSGTANFAISESRLRLYTGSTINSEITVWFGANDMSRPHVRGSYNPCFWMQGGLDNAPNTNGYVGIGEKGTAEHFGFLKEGGNYYVTVANGSNETKLSSSGFPLNPYDECSARLVPGDGVYFYAGGSFKKKVTTNLPSLRMKPMVVYLKNTAATDYSLYVSAFYAGQNQYYTPW